MDKVMLITKKNYYNFIYFFLLDNLVKDVIAAKF